MMKTLIISISISLLLASCARNLKEDVTLQIDEDSVNYSFGAPENGSYLDHSDSSHVYHEIMADLKFAFRDKGNDVTIVSSNADYTMRLVDFHFSEYMTGESVVDPCNSSDTLHYTVSVISAWMKCEVTNNFNGQHVFVEAESESDEDVKGSPTLFQSLIGNDSCYTPRVSDAHPEAMKRRLVRRMHRHVMQAIKSWQ